MLNSQNAISENLTEQTIMIVDTDVLFMRHALAPGIGKGTLKEAKYKIYLD